MTDPRTPEEKRALTAGQHLEHAERYLSWASYFTAGTPAERRPLNPVGGAYMTALAQAHATCAVARLLQERRTENSG